MYLDHKNMENKIEYRYGYSYTQFYFSYFYALNTSIKNINSYTQYILHQKHKK